MEISHGFDSFLLASMYLGRDDDSFNIDTHSMSFADVGLEKLPHILHKWALIFTTSSIVTASTPLFFCSPCSSSFPYTPFLLFRKGFFTKCTKTFLQSEDEFNREKGE